MARPRDECRGDRPGIGSSEQLSGVSGRLGRLRPAAAILGGQPTGRSDRGCRGSFQSRTGTRALSVESGSARQAFPCGGATAASVPCNGIAQSLSSSRVAPKRRSLVSPLSTSFGHAIDLEAFGRVCRERDVFFFVNGSQAVGARRLDLARLPVDALSACGFKWLCGPYATGFVSLSPRILELLDYPNPHWLPLQHRTARRQTPALTTPLQHHSRHRRRPRRARRSQVAPATAALRPTSRPPAPAHGQEFIVVIGQAHLIGSRFHEA